MESTQIQTEITIDGSILEGGGQILRVSADLAFLFQTKTKIIQIRAKRSNPGLQNQHLTSLQCLCNTFKGILYGGKLESKEIEIIPCKIGDIEEVIDCKLQGAGSIGLMIQILMPCLIYATKSTTVNFTGGTYCSFSPPIYYLNDILFPLLKQHMNINVQCELISNGVYPRGGGKVKFITQPLKEKITPITILSRGKLEKIIITYYSNTTFSFSVDDIEKKIWKELKTMLRKDLLSTITHDNPSKEDQEDDDIEEENGSLSHYLQKNRISFGKGPYTFAFQIDLVYSDTRLSTNYIYSSKKEDINAKEQISTGIIEKVQELLENPHACLDEHCVNQLIIFMSLANGKSQIKVGKLSLHTQTAIEILRQFNPSIKINVIPQESEDVNIIEIEGIGL